MSVSVRSLLGKAQMAVAIQCLGSLLRFSNEAIELVLHDDGTLGGREEEELRAALGAVRFERRAAADERVEALLARYPRCREFRRANPLALKLLDVMLLDEGEAVAYCDADILFLRPFAGLFRFDTPEVDAVFMTDRACAYSVRSWDLLVERRLRLAAHVNSGVVSFRRRAYDLDRIEWFLDRWRRAPRTPVWAEQTAWALLAGHARTRLLAPDQIAFPAADPEGGTGAVALHFISPFRGLLPAYAGFEPRPGAPPVRLVTRPARRCTPLDLAASELRRRLARVGARGG